MEFSRELSSLIGTEKQKVPLLIPRMVPVPVKRQRNVFTTTCPQNIVSLPPSDCTYKVVNVCPSTSWHPPVSTGYSFGQGDGYMRYSVPNPEQDEENNAQKSDGPMDLTLASSEQNLEESSSSSPSLMGECSSGEKSIVDSPIGPGGDAEFVGVLPKTIRRKRKSSDEEDEDSSLDGSMSFKNAGGIPRQTGNKREEILKAAKSLFSKRTRTLYHWLYPDTSKTQVKATVAAAWDTLPNEEKEFYISQVLGRFGFPACNLMVNPQLGGLKGVRSDSLLRNSAEESKQAVSSLLLSEGSLNSWDRYNMPLPQRKKRRFCRSSLRPMEGGSRSRFNHNESEDIEETTVLRQITEEPVENEFQDDPELSRELEQFRWALRVNNTIKGYNHPTD